MMNFAGGVDGFVGICYNKHDPRTGRLCAAFDLEKLTVDDFREGSNL
jgi:hypothetical protein